MRQQRGKTLALQSRFATAEVSSQQETINHQPKNDKKREEESKESEEGVSDGATMCTSNMSKENSHSSRYKRSGKIRHKSYQKRYCIQLHGVVHLFY